MQLYPQKHTTYTKLKTMKTAPTPKTTPRPFMLTPRTEEIIRTIYFYRYMNAMDVAHLLFSPSSLTYVRGILSSLAGGTDYKTAQYLYRFPLPTAATGNRERIYTLGSKGRDFLSRELRLPVNWYFRPHKLKHMGFSTVTHNLVLTRFLVAASSWAAREPNFRLMQARISYELQSSVSSVTVAKAGKTETIRVVPDAWLLFERLKNGAHDTSFPILLEIDRGMEYQQKFKRHIASRIEFIRSGEYSKLFDTHAVTIAYATTGQTPEYRESRRRAMCAWTREVLTELHKENWAGIFRFTSLSLDDIYNPALFREPVWFRPDSSEAVPLFTGI